MPFSSAPQRSSLSPLLVLLAPILALALYLNVLDNELAGDAARLTRQNTQVTDAGTWASIWLAPTPPQSAGEGLYRLVLAQLLRLEWLAWGDSPSSFHSVNLILLVLILCLFLILLRALVAESGGRLAAALTLAVHPLLSQSVVSVAGQGLLLSLAACLGAVLLFHYERQDRLRPLWSVLLIGLLALVAAGAHEMGLLLPVWLWAWARLDQFGPRAAAPASRAERRRQAKKESKKSTPADRVSRTWMGLSLVLTLVLIGALVLRVLAMGRLGAAPDVLTQALTSAPVNPLLLGPAIFLRSLWRLVWPVHPTLFYLGYEMTHWAAWSAAGWLALIGLVALAISACRRRKRLAFALILLLTPLLGASHLFDAVFPLSTLISEDALAFALPGLALILGLAVSRLTVSDRLPLSGRLREGLALGLLCLVWLAMIGQTWERSRQWGSAEMLWTAEAVLHPREAQPQIELLDMYVRKLNAEAAQEQAPRARKLARPEQLARITELEAALAMIKNDSAKLASLIEADLKQPGRPDALHLLKLAFFANDQHLGDQAEALWRKTLEAEPNNFEALYHLAGAALDRKDLAEAIKLGGKAVPVASPEWRARALERYGIILAESGKMDAAIEELRAALKLDPTRQMPYVYLARIFWGRKDYESAKVFILSYDANVKMTSKVDVAQLYTGVLESQKRPVEAIDWIKQQVSLYPSDIPLQLFAANFLIQYRQYEPAQQIYRVLGNALKGPDLSDALTGMGLIALNAGRNVKQALGLWSEAVRHNPLNENAKRLIEQYSAQAQAQSQNKFPASPSANTGGSLTLGGAPAASTPTPAAPPAGGANGKFDAAPSGGTMSLGPAATPPPSPAAIIPPKPQASPAAAAPPAKPL